VNDSITYRDWMRRRSYEHRDFTRARLRRRAHSVSVCVPTLDEAASIERTLAPLIALLRDGLIDQVTVVDSGSSDGTTELAAAAGAEVHNARELVPDAGPLLGKGDALWRSLTVVRGEVVCFVDADSEDFGEHFVTGLVGPLLAISGVRFVKGGYRRPFRVGENVMPEGGGRVTELIARPLLNAFYPDLAVFSQPLAGEIGARRSLLLQIPFDTGYAVETGMLIDVWSREGLEGMAEVNLGSRQNRHRTLAELTPMAATVLQSVTSRLRREGRLSGLTSTRLVAPLDFDGEQSIEVVQRPPMAERLARGAEGLGRLRAGGT
jgi:glucosyl-3-phosphoglycerate synthase